MPFSPNTTTGAETAEWRFSLGDQFGGRECSQDNCVAGLQRFASQCNALSCQALDIKHLHAAAGEFLFDPGRPAIADDVGSAVEHDDFITHAGEVFRNQDQPGIGKNDAGGRFDVG